MARERSPNYPAISLPKAIEAVKALYTREGRTPTPAEVAAKAWGYKSLSGPARSKIGALRQYDLVTQRKGNVTPTDLALTIILRTQDTPERRAALRRAALAPAIFAELYDTHRDASDDALKHHLVIDRRFTDDGAKRLMESYRETCDFAQLEGPSYEDPNRDGQDGEERNLNSGEAQTIKLPISPTRWTILQGNFPITEAEWGQMMAVLNAMKPALVHSGSAEDGS